MLPKGYEQVRVLGVGGFGEVVLARQVGLDRLVAVKRLRARDLAGPDEVARFHREAQVLAALKHPAIVRVYDFRREGGDATLVMEYVEGASLADLIGELTPARALRALDDVAEALHTAHEHHVIHRDVKPDNVFVLRDGHAKLGDFGLARAVADPSVFRTTDGDIRCTPAYFAPELGQQLGEPDARSDAYAFAVMAYEVLTGRLPYDDVGGLALIAAHWTREPPDPADLVPGFPPEASAALLAGLAKDPSVRLSPRQLVARLRTATAWPELPRRTGGRAPRTQALAPPVPVPTLPRRAARRWPLVLTAALVLGGAIAYGTTRTGAHPALTVSDVRLTAEPANGVGHCPRARFLFLGVVATNGGAGSLRLQWTRPDGVLTAPESIKVGAGQRSVRVSLDLVVTGQRPVNGAAVLHLLAPDVRDTTLEGIHYSC
ncbi:MAG: hypothetical protein JWO12_1729 [Frankiales bacterium]|nr:hypothetical protein [Frankiales bacterium]